MDDTTDPMTLQVVIDCAAPHELADWWAATLGWEVESQDEAFIRRMIAEGHATQEETTTHRGALVWRIGAAVNAPEPGAGQLRLLFQQVPEGKAVKNRVHLDLRPVAGTDLDEARARIERRGATRVGEGRQGPHSWVVFTDPEGNEFCI